MKDYIFSASRQLMFYVNIGGVMRLVQFGARNANGQSVFMTNNKNTAEAIRKHSLFRRGVVTEFEASDEPEKPATKVTGTERRTRPAEPATEGTGTERRTEEPAEPDEPATEGAGTERGTERSTEQGTEQGEEVIEAKNYTQARSLLAKRLEISYNDIKNPEQLIKLAKDAGITVKY